MRTLATELAAFLTGGVAPVTEHERMTPLTDMTAGRFLSPLKDAP